MLECFEYLYLVKMVYLFAPVYQNCFCLLISFSFLLFSLLLYLDVTSLQFVHYPLLLLQNNFTKMLSNLVLV